MTNKEMAVTLRRLADIHDAMESEEEPKLRLSCHVWSKEELVKTLKTFGGSWKKVINGDWLRLSSVTFPGLELSCSRDAVCRKVVSYECTPILSKEEESFASIEDAA